MSNTKLMVVDDDPGIRSQLRWGLDDYDVITSDSRADAVDKLLKYKPRVVTLDLGLPPDEEGTSEGFKVLKEILDLEPGTKVVVVSGSGEKENAAKAKKIGAYGYFSKPVDIIRLKEIIELAHAE